MYGRLRIQDVLAYVFAKFLVTGFEEKDEAKPCNN